jgi:cardiolipin synthase
MRILEWIKDVPKWQFWDTYGWLETLLLVMGAITLFYLIVFLFTSMGEDHRPPFTDETLSLKDLDEFEATLAYTIGGSVDEGGEIRTLENGAEFMPDMLSEINAAHNYIYIANYLWDDGTFSTKLFDALGAKAKEGVRVRVLLDGLGGKGVRKETIKKLEDAGGKVDTFRPLRWWNINRWDSRTHMRDIVIDGKVGYLGGIAFTDAWMGDATSSTAWHDYMFKVDGQFARRLESVFSNLWSQTTGEILPANQVEDFGSKRGAKVRFVALYSSPAPDTSSDMEHFIWLSIMSARKTIYIENPYILPSKSIKEALIYKAKQGVDVRIIGPNGTDAKHVKWASQSYYSELLANGIKVYEYQPSRIHAKVMVIDSTWSMIGSANLDNRSSRINIELVAGTDDPVLAHTLMEKFANDQNSSQEITKEFWDGRSLYFMPIRLLSRLFVRQY